MAPGSVTIDTQFASCRDAYSNDGWSYLKCNECGAKVCGHCVMVCHTNCNHVVSLSWERCEYKGKVCTL